MKKTGNFKKSIKRTVSVILCFCIAVLSACSANNTQIRTVKSVETRNVISMPAENSAVHYSKSADSFTETAAVSGLIKLCIDPETNSFCIIESTKNKLWSSLPLLSNLAQGEELLSDASVASITVNAGTDVYELNTQDNSLAYGKASYSITDSGAEFVYDIFSDKKTAEKEKFESTDIGFRVNVTVTLTDGSMLVDCSYKNLTDNKDAFIEKLDILNGFGSYNESGEDDFLLVPDGSGAIIKTAIYDESFEPLSFSVYGNDPSTSYESSGNAIVPAFGIKHGDSAFAALIRKGDAVACINADKAKSISEYNKVYSSFYVTPVLYENEKLYVSKEAAVNEISLCYRFLSGKNATYSGLASACREQLIRDSVLSTKNTAATDYLPFFLTLTGAANTSHGLKKLTTFEQARDMLIRMKNKGINNVSVRYTGIFSGGTDSQAIEDSSLLLRLGGKNKLDELNEYITAQKMNLFIDVNLLSSSKSFGSDNAKNIIKENGVYNPENPLNSYIGTSSKSRYLRNVNALSDTVSQIIKDTDEYEFSGFCLNDAGSVLYSDFSPNGLLRQDAAKEISQSIAPLSTGYSTMTSNGNFYMLKNIDSVINLPLKATVSESGAYISVPFVQLILHGTADYSGEAININTNHNELMLKFIEYGACPHYEWNYGYTTENSQDDIFCYDNTINSAAEFYTKANEVLNDLRDARMTDHYEVDDGVFCTEYDTGSMVYVNYTDNDFTVLGAVVEARNFIRIN